MAASENSSAAGRIAFTYPSFVFFQLARVFIVLSGEMQSVAVGWEIYEITQRTLALGFVGLAQFLPGILFFLVSVHSAHRSNRRKLPVPSADRRRARSFLNWFLRRTSRTPWPGLRCSFKVP